MLGSCELGNLRENPAYRIPGHPYLACNGGLLVPTKKVFLPSHSPSPLYSGDEQVESLERHFHGPMNAQT